MLKTTVLVRALQLAFSAATLSTLLAPAAFAQSNASGNIVGRVDAPAGATIMLNNTETGLKRAVTLDASGRYQATALPAGHYRVDLVRNGQAVQSSEVDIIIGQGVDASFIGGGGAMQQVEVKAARTRIDVSSANNGATFNARELAALPIAQSVDAIIQLAPNTTRADPRYAAGASFGGGGASENAYYVNGFPVTNPLTQLGASELPFGAIAQAQVLTGGFGAEFGRSVGGVVNITTKSGTNNWEAGAQYSIEPNRLRAKPKDVYYARTGDPANVDTDGTLYARNSLNHETQQRGGFYVGGPILQDKLFMFLSAERIQNKTSGVAGTTAAIDNDATGWLERKDTTTRYMGKLDWNITDNHRLEFTTLGDKPESERNYSDYDYASGVHSGVVQSGGHYESIANVTPTTGAKTNILKYTGTLTDNLTVTALVGKNKTEHVMNLLNYNGGVPGVSAAPSAQAPGFTYNNPQPFVGQRLGAPYSFDEVKSQRLDLEYKLGNHTIRGGFDNNKLSSAGAGEETAGHFTWVYGHSDTPTEPATLNGTKGVIIANGGGLGPQGYYVYRSIFSDITAAYSDQSAQYLEDRWQVGKNLLVTLGVRDEQYKNRNGEGIAFLKIDKQINPRLAAVWDANGDASLKVFGSAGRYSIQIPTHVAVRGASRSTLTREYFTYTGVGADGQPTGLNNLTPVTSSDNEFGQEKLYQTVSAQNIKPSYQDEITLGFERAVSPRLNIGAKFTYRQLKSTIDDFCDGRPFEAYAAAHSIDTSNWGGFTCASINPGESNDFLVDFSGTGKNFTPVTLSARDMGFPKATRVYRALDVFAEHPLRDGWYGKINYSLSRSKGNTEGQTLSAIAQTDVAATQTWDHRELMEYASGLLPNDRLHQVKAFGFWEFVPQWTVGANFLAASGQPESCLGNYPLALQTDGFPDYGSAYHYCNGAAGQNLASPQGTAGRLPWDVRLDMDLIYKPTFLKGLALKMDVFNVFNKQVVQQLDQTYNTDTGSISPTYGTPGPFVGYTQGRSVKFTVEYNHKF